MNWGRSSMIAWTVGSRIVRVRELNSRKLAPSQLGQGRAEPSAPELTESDRDAVSQYPIIRRKSVRGAPGGSSSKEEPNCRVPTPMVACSSWSVTTFNRPSKKG